MSTLECPVCLEVLKPPIKPCVNGHAVCGDCQSKIVSCPECREDLIFRNTALERALDEIPIACKNQGCHVKMTRGEMTLTSHEKLCEYRTVTCYMSGWGCPDPAGTKMSMNSLVKHLTEKHKNETCLVNPSAATPLSLTSVVNARSHTLLRYSNEFFIRRFYLNTETKELSNDVRYVGKTADAGKYMYTVTIDQGMGGGLYFTYTNYCLPYFDNDDQPPIPHRRLEFKDYRDLIHRDISADETVDSKRKIFPATKPPSK